MNGSHHGYRCGILGCCFSLIGIIQKYFPFRHKMTLLRPEIAMDVFSKAYLKTICCCRTPDGCFARSKRSYMSLRSPTWSFSSGRGITKTGFLEWRRTFSATLPKRAWIRTPFPWVPIRIISQYHKSLKLLNQKNGFFKSMLQSLPFILFRWNT